MTASPLALNISAYCRKKVAYLPRISLIAISMKNVEFYTFEDQIWYRTEDGNQHHLTESDRDAIRFIIEKFREFYPEALEASLNEYKRCQANLPHYQYRVVLRLCKCNFGVIDTHISDVDASGCFHFEHVPCPLRGECKFENIICHPKFNSKISDSEMRVIELLSRGLGRNQIADELCLSPHTVHNHIRNASVRIGVHKESELIAYAHKHSLFKEE